MNRSIIFAALILSGCDTSDGIGEPAACPVYNAGLVPCSSEQAASAECPGACFSYEESTCCAFTCDGGVCK